MARQKNTKSHNIFLIDDSRLEGEGSIEDKLSRIMEGDKRYEIQTLKDGIDTKGFLLRFYFKGDDNYQTRFSSFCASFVADGEQSVTFYPRTTSSVLFVWNEKHIYAITTGQGYRMIEAYVMPKFGLIVASIFEEKFKVTSLDSNTISSIVHSSKMVYSNEVDFINVRTLDTIFKEISGRLNDVPKVRSLLNLMPSSKKRSVKLIAKNSLRLGHASDFMGLLHLLTVMDLYDFEGIQDRFNLIVPLTPKYDSDEISKNNKEVISTMYADIKARRRMSFDVFHESLDDYISSDVYVVYNSKSKEEYGQSDGYIDGEALLAAYNAYRKGKDDCLATFEKFVNAVSIRTDRDDYPSVTAAPLLQHISGEVQVAGTNYFIFYGKFYRLSTSYTKRLNDSLRGKLREDFFVQEIKTQWLPEKDEDWFNETVSKSEDYIHLHKVKPEQIEFADLLKVENDTITVVHVKDGFDCDMRALDRQVELSIAKVLDVKNHNNDSYMRELYTHALNHSIGKNIYTVFPTEDEFVTCIKKSTIRYLIVIRPKCKDLLESSSNIAKHCLNALIYRCFQQGVELRIQKCIGDSAL